MVISTKIKALMALSLRKNAQLAGYFGISPQSMNNKISRGSFSAEDLIKVAEFTDCQLFFELDNGQRIYLRMKDDNRENRAQSVAGPQPLHR